MNYRSVATVELGRSRNSQPAEAKPRTLLSFSCCASPACDHTALYSSFKLSTSKSRLVPVYMTFASEFTSPPTCFLDMEQLNLYHCGLSNRHAERQVRSMRELL